MGGTSAGPNPSPPWCGTRGLAFTHLEEEEKKLHSAKFIHLGLAMVILLPMPMNLNRKALGKVFLCGSGRDAARNVLEKGVSTWGCCQSP